MGLSRKENKKVGKKEKNEEDDRLRRRHPSNKKLNRTEKPM